MRDFHLNGRSAVYGCNGMVAASNPLASKVAVQILESGGNAVDAAIAAAVLQGVCEPQMTGIGGDCFILFAPKGGADVVALNGSGRAPAALSADKIRADGHRTMPTNGVESVTIPGAIDAFCRLSKDHGKIGLKASLAPAIHYMKQGVPVGPRTSFDWDLAADRLQGVARAFYLQNGQAPKAGQMFAAPKQAEVLELVAEHGPTGFYQGAVAEDMVQSLRGLGGVHTLDDFASVACEYTDPIQGEFGGYDLIEHPPNGQGATAICMSNILSHFDIASMDPYGVQRAHIEAEAAKLAYDARNRFIADQCDHLDHMLSVDTAVKMAGLIDPKRAMPCATRMSESVHKDTICLSVVDRDLNAVSLIYSVFHSFGSGLASEKYGINFQNRGAGFTLTPNHPNEAGGGKRPMHTIIPALLAQGDKVIMPFGVMGGAYQPNGHVRFISNLVDFGMDLQRAIDGPRAFCDAGEMKVERGYSAPVRQGLADLGHEVTIPKVPIGGAQAVWIDHKNGVLVGASDPRKDGAALGY
ncbi:gamma-glutamyltransferase [Amylibacter marinus]|uniref:Gamma-glutamyltransferase n=1 Tax=Amylibacter marinus TaxID=1475483 RepID=A0ABQ5VVV1_9RHOB|nr:gamma-glutamyltransferase family protein [Amylibacter marinus]GLQ35424.1 gamma-glutamyltransferase [Amylibacter marinus]